MTDLRSNLLACALNRIRIARTVHFAGKVWRRGEHWIMHTLLFIFPHKPPAFIRNIAAGALLKKAGAVSMRFSHSTIAGQNPSAEVSQDSSQNNDRLLLVLSSIMPLFSYCHSIYYSSKAVLGIVRMHRNVFLTGTLAETETRQRIDQHRGYQPV